MRAMYSRPSVKATVLALSSVALLGCTDLLGRQYEYEEQLYLEVDGSAELVVDSSIAALVALRNLPLEPDPSVPVDRDRVAAAYSAPGCGDVTVNRPWMRDGRRFVQVVLEQTDVRNFSGCPPLAWSTFSFEREAADEGDQIHYSQVLGPPSAGDPGSVNWTGEELVGFKLHVPSRITYHNVRRLEDGQPGQPDRGNILTWEQALDDRRLGRQIHMEVRMLAQSTLRRALVLFAAAFSAAVLTIFAVVWVVLRRARRRPFAAA